MSSVFGVSDFTLAVDTLFSDFPETEEVPAFFVDFSSTADCTDAVFFEAGFAVTVSSAFLALVVFTGSAFVGFAFSAVAFVTFAFPSLADFGVATFDGAFVDALGDVVALVAFAVFAVVAAFIGEAAFFVTAFVGAAFLIEALELLDVVALATSDTSLRDGSTE